MDVKVYSAHNHSERGNGSFPIFTVLGTPGLSDQEDELFTASQIFSSEIQDSGLAKKALLRGFSSVHR